MSPHTHSIHNDAGSGHKAVWSPAYIRPYAGADIRKRLWWASVAYRDAHPLELEQTHEAEGEK